MILTKKNKIYRLIWQLVYFLIFKPSPVIFFGFRSVLLRLFGAKVGVGVHVYPYAKIWAPFNLTICDGGCIANYVDCYNVAPVIIGKNSVISQYTFICTATHNFRAVSNDLDAKSIEIGDGAWVASDVYLGPGVKVGSNAVVGARSTVLKNIPPNKVCFSKVEMIVREP